MGIVSEVVLGIGRGGLAVGTEGGGWEGEGERCSKRIENRNGNRIRIHIGAGEEVGRGMGSEYEWDEE